MTMTENWMLSLKYPIMNKVYGLHIIVQQRLNLGNFFNPRAIESKGTARNVP